MHRTVQCVDITGSPKKRPYLRAEDRRRQLLDAAGRLFDRSGFGGVTMAGLAAEAGVSRQLVYDRFADLDRLYEAFVEDRLARYRDGVPDISALRADEAAATMFHYLLTIPPTDRRVVRLLVADVGLAALEPVRERFLREERARWSTRWGSERPHAAPAAVLLATTSALLSLADASTAGEIAEDEATQVAVDFVRAASRTAAGEV